MMDILAREVKRSIEERCEERTSIAFFPDVSSYVLAGISSRVSALSIYPFPSTTPSQLSAIKSFGRIKTVDLGGVEFPKEWKVEERNVNKFVYYVVEKSEGEVILFPFGGDIVFSLDIGKEEKEETLKKLKRKPNVVWFAKFVARKFSKKVDFPFMDGKLLSFVLSVVEGEEEGNILEEILPLLGLKPFPLR